MKIEKKVLDMSLAGIFTAIIIAMSVVPFLGYIPLVRRLLRTGIWCDQPCKSDHCPGSDLLRIQPVRYDRRIQRKHVERRDRHRAACMHRHRCLFCL